MTGDGVFEQIFVCELTEKLHISGVIQTINITHTFRNRSAELIVIKKKYKLLPLVLLQKRERCFDHVCFIIE
jgi:hypothetical protein